jgi:tRNA(Ile)-lysidine synthase
MLGYVMPIEETLLQSVQQYKLFSAHQHVVVAVSGGMDSVCLLHLLCYLRDELKITLHVATFHHGIRAEQADADVQLVQEIAQTWQLPCYVGYVRDFIDSDNSPQSLSSLNEAEARRYRYKFLAQVARQIGTNTIVTAHHADDQAETVLHRIIRGTTTHGLRAMQYRAPLPYAPDLFVVRPLLDIPRSEIHSFCQQAQIEYHHDATNDDTTYTRNALRLHVLPMLEKYNPAIRSALLRLAQSSSLEDDFITQYVHQTILPTLKVDEHRIVFPLEQSQQWHPALQYRALRWAIQHLHIQQLDDDVAEVTFVQMQAAIQLFERPHVGKIIELAGTLRLRCTYEALILEDTKRAPSDLPHMAIKPSTQIPLQINRHYDFDTWHLQLTTKPPTEEYNLIYSLYLDTSASVILRTRQSGDRFRPIGLRGHHQKLKDWFINRKIPAEWRDHIPLLIVNDVVMAILLNDDVVLAWDTQVEPIDSSKTCWLAIRKE